MRMVSENKLKYKKSVSSIESVGSELKVRKIHTDVKKKSNELHKKAELLRAKK